MCVCALPTPSGSRTRRRNRQCHLIKEQHELQITGDPASDGAVIPRVQEVAQPSPQSAHHRLRQGQPTAFTQADQPPSLPQTVFQPSPAQAQSSPLSPRLSASTPSLPLLLPPVAAPSQPAQYYRDSGLSHIPARSQQASDSSLPLAGGEPPSLARQTSQGPILLRSPRQARTDSSQSEKSVYQDSYEPDESHTSSAVTGHSPPGSANNFRESVSSTSSGRPSDFYSPRLPTGYTDRSSVSSISSLSTTSSLSSAAAESIPGHTNHSVAAESIPGRTSHSAATESIPGHTNHSVAAESIPGHTNHLASPGSHPSNGMDSSSPQGKTHTPSNLENCFPYLTMVSSKLSLVSISFKGIKLHQHLKFPQLMMQLENKEPTGTALKKKKDKEETNHF